MLSLKVSEVLNEKSRDHGSAHFVSCSQKITLALLGDRNFGIRIGSKGWVGGTWVQRGLRVGLGAYCNWARHCHPPPCLG
jgi:hypothetical protein